MLAIESYAYNRTRVGLEDKERVNVARYLVHLGFLGDLSQNSRTYLMQFSDEGTKGFARGLEMRSKVYQGAAASFEGQWAPPEAIGAHRRLVRCLRDLAAIDRRAATELTIRGHLDGFVSGEAETQDALSKINDALNEIKTGISSMFINGDLDSVIIGVMKSVVPK